ncbi:MAG: hypothetical protein FJZ00_10380, partial [Candidatus Sericytochromatia bacterium]|nr:hypothetical protein [Candidatus Tanganyikabacteria bacterium]
YTRTGVGTSIAHGRETRTICGREYLFEAPLQADVALIRAHRGDALGNLTHRKTARNGNPVMATAADLVVAEVEHLVELGDIDADAVHTPGIYVDRIVQGMRYERRIEYRTVRPRGSRPRATKEANGMPKSGFNRNELVLIADPHYDRLIARLSLESEGYDVEVVNSLAAARRRAGEALPAVVVLDCEDCCLEGQALMRDLKCDPRTADIAVVALTACRGLDGACLALSAGCDRVMHKNQAVDLPRHMELLLRGPLG